MDNIKLISKDNFYALYKNTRYMTYSYRCSSNYDIVFCEYSSIEKLRNEIKKHIEQKHKQIRAIEFMSDWFWEEKQRLKSLYNLLEVLNNEEEGIFTYRDTDSITYFINNNCDVCSDDNRQS